MNIDEMFKIPSIPSGRNKRKMPAMPDVNFLENYRADSDSTDIAESSNNDTTETRKRRNVTIEDAMDDEDVRYGSSSLNDVADNDDGAYGYDQAEADEEGRFFGGGLTEEQSRLLDLVDEYDVEESEALTAANVKKMILKFEKAINKNQAQRVRYADDPQKFMESEADLDEEIKNLLTLTQAPHLYVEIVKLGSVASITSLLSHENTDIALDAIDLINELTDEDVGTGEEEMERSEDATGGVKALVDALLENELLELLIQNLERLDENEESDRQGIFKVLGIFENIVGLDTKFAERIALETEFLPWLLKRIQSKSYDSNRGYASEILSILLQDNRDIRLKVGELGGVDILLRVLSSYRKRDPEDDDETEMVENFFDALCSMLNEPETKKLFLEGEGIELMVMMLKERTLARIRAMKVLNYAMSGEAGRGNCIRFVDATGLKVLFPIFMGKGIKKLKKSHSKSFVESEDDEHTMCIILSLMRNLSREDLQRLRLVRKFTEDNYEKVDRLLEMKEFLESKDKRVKAEIEAESKDLDQEDLEDMEDEFYLRRLEAGLFTLQRVCLVIAALCKEDEGVKNRTMMLLKRQGSDISSIFRIIEEETALMADFSYLQRMAAGGAVEPDTQR